MRCDAFYEKGLALPLMRFGAIAAVYTLAVIAVVAFDSLWVTAAGGVVAALCACRLFIIAHDACHGSFTGNRIVNAVVGRLAFLPAWHNFSLWTYFHNGVHHQFTNLAGRDYVWVPLSWQEFSRLPRWRRLAERLFRHPTTLGFPLYYIARLWAPKLILPFSRMPRHVRRRSLGDLALPLAYPALLTIAVLLAHLREAEVDALGLSLDLAAAVVMPFVAVSWAIGFVVYFNHTHPRIPWFRDERAWRRAFHQFEGATMLRASGVWQWLIPGPIMNHTAHHYDPRIPVGKLAAAHAFIARQRNRPNHVWYWTPRKHWMVMRRCALFDYETGQWQAFPKPRRQA